MCLPGLCPGDRFDRMGEHLDKQIASLAEQLRGGSTITKHPPKPR